MASLVNRLTKLILERAARVVNTGATSPDTTR